MPDTRHATDRGLSLLGGWQLVEDGESIALGGREQRLCALLALTGARARAQVAGTLWPESTDARALASLRRALAQTRDRCPGLLVADRTSVGLAPDVVVDVHVLRACAARAGEPDAGAALLATLAGDPLLPGWYDEWVEVQRDELERLRVDALEHLARRALERGDTGLAEGAARAVARIEPWRESASELVIRGLLGRGDRAGAVRELERYREVLRVELGVVPSPALVALVDAPETAPVPAPVPLARPVPVVVPAQRRAPAQESVEGPARSATPSPQPPPPPNPTPPTGPAGLTARAAAARLAAGAVLVMAASLAIANLGPGAEPEPPSSVPETAAQEQAAGAGLATAVRQVLVRPVAAADGAAAFLVRATRRPARVRVEVADGSGSSVVRSVLVRSRDGRRLVLTGLDGGTYEWSATSPTASPVTGEVEVSAQPSGLVAAPEPSVRTTPSPSPSPSPSAASPTSVPSVTPTQQPIQQPTQQPTQQASPHPSPHPSPPPSPTRPGPSSGPTDPGTQDPGLVG